MAKGKITYSHESLPIRKKARKAGLIFYATNIALRFYKKEGYKSNHGICSSSFTLAVISLPFLGLMAM